MRLKLPIPLVLLLACLVLPGCSASNKNVTSEEVETVKKAMTGGQSDEMVKNIKWKSFEGMEDPDNKKIKYVRVLYVTKDDSTTRDMLVRLEDGKPAGQTPNPHGDSWQKKISEVKFPGKGGP